LAENEIFDGEKRIDVIVCLHVDVLELRPALQPPVRCASMLFARSYQSPAAYI
jgi:hypothetical protein